MGCAFAGVRVLVDLLCTMATLPTGTFVAARIGHPGYCASVASRFVFAQASFVQTDADVRSGEVNQRRRQLVEPDGARLSLLVATAADDVRLVGGQESGVV